MWPFRNRENQIPPIYGVPLDVAVGESRRCRPIICTLVPLGIGSIKTRAPRNKKFNAFGLEVSVVLGGHDFCRGRGRSRCGCAPVPRMGVEAAARMLLICRCAIYRTPTGHIAPHRASPPIIGYAFEFISLLKP